MKTRIQSAPVASVTVGPPSWRDESVRSIQRAEHLRRLAYVDTLEPTARYRRPTFSSGLPDLAGHSVNKVEEKEICEDINKMQSPPKSTSTMWKLHSLSTHGPFPPPALRDQSTEVSVGLAGDYMRSVREVEGHLRRQAARVTQEATKLEHQREKLEKLLRSIRKALLVNQQGLEGRTLRPAATETRKDGVDLLLSDECKGLNELKLKLESILRNTLTQQQALANSSRQILLCAFERSKVMELLPQHGSPSAAMHLSPSPLSMQPHAAGPFTPECKEALESSAAVLQKSLQLRENIKLTMSDAIVKQTTLHHSVNDGLSKKISETLDLQHHLTLSSGATRQAIYRKQRQMQCASYSHGRVLGPVSREDFFCRERLDRPVVQVFKRHQSFSLPESRLLTQGSATLKQHLDTAEKAVEELQSAHSQLVHDACGKRIAAGVESAVYRLRRRLVLPVCVQAANAKI